MSLGWCKGVIRVVSGGCLTQQRGDAGQQGGAIRVVFGWCLTQQRVVIRVV